jgi:hypothetical protein
MFIAYEKSKKKKKNLQRMQKRTERGQVRKEGGKDVTYTK